MSSPTSSPIVIGSYCADFTITQPESGLDYYYYRFQYCGISYYLASSKVIDGKEPILGATGTSSSIRVIESPYVVPTNVQKNAITNGIPSPNQSDNFREFRFRPVWDPTFTPDFTNPSSIVPLDQRRYLTWNSSTNDVTNRYSSAAMVERFVRITSKSGSIDDNLTIKFDGASATSTATSGITTGSNFTAGNASSGTPCSPSVKPSITNMVFTATHISPTIQERAPRLVYLILKSDFDKLRSDAVTASKTLRYLTRGDVSGGVFNLRDLYDPQVTVSDIKKCAYRVSKQTNVDISPALGSTSSSVTTWTQDTTWGVDAFLHTSEININVGSTSDPQSATKYPYATAFGTAVTSTTGRLNGFVAGDFSKYSDGTPYTDSSLVSENLLESGFNNVVITIPTLNYVEFENETYVQKTGTNMQFVMTDFIVDKAVEELFTDMNVTLLRLAQIRFASASSPVLTPPANTGTEHYLGFENITPSATVVAEAYAAKPTSNYLITRDYFKFREPTRATQFKFYDLGRGVEYLWQVRWPQGTNNETYAYVSFDGTSLSFLKSSDITPDVRGWILEYVTGMTPPGVLLKWAATNQYVVMDTDLTKYDGSTDGKPRKVSASLGSRINAAVFNCIQCSQIDVSGACKAITTNPRTGGFNQQSTTQITITGGSPLPVSGPFKLRLVSSPSPSGVTRFLYYTLTQIASSPAVASPQPPSALIVSSISPIPPNSVVDFEFSRNGVMRQSSIARNAVFIKDVSGDRYLKFNTAGNSNRVELQPSNRPSDEDGFAWIIETTGNSSQFRLYSILPSNAAASTNRYLSTNGMFLVPKGESAIFVFEGLTMPSSPSSMTVSNASV